MPSVHPSNDRGPTTTCLPGPSRLQGSNNQRGNKATKQLRRVYTQISLSGSGAFKVEPGEASTSAHVRASRPAGCAARQAARGRRGSAPRGFVAKGSRALSSSAPNRPRRECNVSPRAILPGITFLSHRPARPQRRLGHWTGPPPERWRVCLQTGHGWGLECVLQPHQGQRLGQPHW